VHEVGVEDVLQLDLLHLPLHELREHAPETLHALLVKGANAMIF
jgi:hypothetical protein